MDSTTLIVVIAVAVVVLLAVLAVVVTMQRKRQHDREMRRQQAGQLREEATAAVPDVRTAAERLHHAEARAELAHVEAAKADEEVVELRRVHAAEEAHREDHLREADRIDPDTRNDG